jgi:hypothetical protein
MTTAWDDQIVLEGFFDERTSHCWLGRRDYPRSQVLNQRIMNSLKFHGHDDMVEGVILFTGLKPMPVEFYHGMAVRFTLIFLDQNENEIRQEADLFVGRTWRREQKVARQNSSLYERRVTHTCLRGKNVFDEELMRPQIAEIVLVGKPRGLPRDDIL